ncbi:alpha/beta hydrolase [Cellulomonas wangsupingiae]|uniref:alpha/beta hydrolase n=1 Tax=Cellulomonas wangsupingiae TaxID=2968085 RepID=UPI001D0E4F63|nr:alpha/beta hydrolase-fold protein [Cellulomonas wangsupingiae]MCM0641177.1 alpha/beta hydrolase-fold protein [Cellulomonas wangsupingiae]
MVPGAAADPGDAPAPDPWVSVADGYHRVTVPQAAAHEIIGGTPARLELEGNIGPNGTWARLAMDPSGDTYPGGFGPLAPGLYVYEYTATMPDLSQVRFKEPSSPVAVTSHPTWNTIFVPGESVQWMSDLPAGGAVAPMTYDSDVTGGERSALVWTPPGYDADRAEAYPVLYLLADEAQTAQEWAELGRAPQILDNLAAEGALEPMVVVMADVDVDDPVSELVDNLVVASRERLNVTDRPAHQAVAGIGTGATTALQALVAGPGEFAAVGSFSGALDTPIDAATAQAIDEGTDLLRLYVGNELDPAHNDTYDLVQRFAAAGVDVEVDGVNPESGGTWDSWRENLRDFASRAFRGSDGAPSPGHRPLDGRYTPPAVGSVDRPHVDENGIVTFETGTQWADAREVTVWANWAPNGAWFRVPMTKVGDRWRVTVGPLDGYYYYRYVVDGVDHKDPADTETTLTGVTPLFVPGETDHMYADAPVGERGRVSTLAYDSAVAGEERKALVWTPPGYDADRVEPYPVLYLNHGGGQSYGDWIETGRAAQILDNHYRQGAIVPMVVVMGNGNVPDFQAELFDNLMPAVDGAYHVSSEPSRRAMAGLSMGAMNTLSTWFARPGEFAYIGAFSGFLFSYPPTDVAAMNAGTKLARIYTGDTTDFTYSFTMGLVDVLKERGIEHEFAGVTVGPHGFDTWMQNLVDFLPRIFRPETSAGIPIEATVAEAENGVLALTVADHGPAVVLSRATNVGDRLRSAGELPTVTVTDSRSVSQAGASGWAVTGQGYRFTSGVGSFGADRLGWTPRLGTQREGLAAGGPVSTSMSAGTGLAVPATLASANARGRFGSAPVGADLVLDVPVDTAPGTYTGTLTLSLFPVD